MLTTYFVITLLIPPALTALYYYVFIVMGRDEVMRFAQGMMSYLSWGIMIPVIFLVVEAIISGGLPELASRPVWAAVLILLYFIEGLLAWVFLGIIPAKKKAAQQNAAGMGALFASGYALLFAAFGWVLLMV